MHKSAVYFLPVVNSLAVHYLHGYLLETLLIARLRNLGHYLFLVNVLLKREQNLVWVDRLNQIVGYLRAYCLVHNILLLALCHHHNRRGRLYLLYLLKSFKSGKSRHHLVEQHKVEGVLAALLYGIGTVAYSHYLVAFLLQKYNMCAKEFYLVVAP